MRLKRFAAFDFTSDGQSHKVFVFWLLDASSIQRALAIIRASTPGKKRLR